MKINKTMAIAVLILGLLVAGLAGGLLFSQLPLQAVAAPPAQEGDDTEEAGEVEDQAENEAGESEETVSPTQAGITVDEAKAAAEKAYPGSKALEAELERANGVVAYEVELDNGLEVLIDPTNGQVLGR